MQFNQSAVWFQPEKKQPENLVSTKVLSTDNNKNNKCFLRNKSAY